MHSAAAATMSRERVGASPRPAQGQDARLETRRGASPSQRTGAHQAVFELDVKVTELNKVIPFKWFPCLVENN